MTPTEQIRPATEGDLDNLAVLYHEFHEFHVRGLPDYLQTLGDLASFETAELHKALHHILVNKDAAIFVAEQNGRLLGFVEVYLHRTDPEHQAVVPRTYGLVQSLMVTASARGRSLGRILLTAAEQWVHTHGGREVELNVWEFAAVRSASMNILAITPLNVR